MKDWKKLCVDDLRMTYPKSSEPSAYASQRVVWQIAITRNSIKSCEKRSRADQPFPPPSYKGHKMPVPIHYSLNLCKEFCKKFASFIPNCSFWHCCRIPWREGLQEARRASSRDCIRECYHSYYIPSMVTPVSWRSWMVLVQPVSSGERSLHLAKKMLV